MAAYTAIGSQQTAPPFFRVPHRVGAQAGAYHARPHAQRTTPSGGNTLPSGGAIGYASSYIEYAAICTDSKPFAANNGSY